jgi:vesicular inhibitory amino acid transporter
MTCFLELNVATGVGILSTPYALAQGGWLSMAFLLLFASICLYTGILLKRCLETDSAILTYPDIGQAAFGGKGRFLVSLLLYFELYCVTVEFLILEGDNLASLFPFGGAGIGSLQFTQEQMYIMLSALIMLPTLLLRDLSLLAYISAGGVVASLAIVSAVGYAGAFDGIGFHHTGTLFNISGLPVSVGVYAFCFCGHAVFPSIYRSMNRRQDFSKVTALPLLSCLLRACWRVNTLHLGACQLSIRSFLVLKPCRQDFKDHLYSL